MRRRSRVFSCGPWRGNGYAVLPRMHPICALRHTASRTRHACERHKCLTSNDL
jgi:putative component of membrane protein insertase Oxa1/YidC/SpoIIIJ protein YidD